MYKLLLNLCCSAKILYLSFTRIMQYDEGVAGTDLRAASQQPRQFAWLAFNCETHQSHSIGSSHTLCLTFPLDVYRFFSYLFFVFFGVYATKIKKM